MQEFKIQPLSKDLNDQITNKINLKTKPLGSLGKLESIATQICRIQHTLSPSLSNPTMFVCAGDHGITEEGVSPFPQEVTWQMVLNFLSGGAGINVFARQHDFRLKVVDCGVKYNFEEHNDLINAKVAQGTANFLYQPAMTKEQCMKAIENGSRLVEECFKSGSNIVSFGEMGIGNTTSASALLCKLTGCQPADASGSGTGLDQEGIRHKAEVIGKALQKHIDVKDAFDVLCTFGGLEIATMVGGMLKAAELKMIILLDGFITTSAMLCAHAINPIVIDYTIASHLSNEKAHQLMLKTLGMEPVLHLGMRLGEGTGAAVVYPIIESAVRFVNEMNSFEGAGVSQTNSEVMA